MSTRQMLAHADGPGRMHSWAEGPVGWMTFDNQARRNAVSAEMWAAIAANAPLTLAALKLTVAELLRGHEADLPRADAAVTACFSSADYKEGRTAFMEKRSPVFQGR